MTMKLNQLGESLIHRIESRTGKTAEELKSETLWQKRIRVSAANGKTMQFTRNFPLIGRGCVLGNHLITSHEVNSEIDQLLFSRS